jgi:hypothetical protein
MAIVSVLEDYQAREADDKMSLNLQAVQIVSIYKRRFVVQTSDRTVGGKAVKTAVGIPKPYDAYPDDAGAWCNEIDAKPRSGHPTCWDVVVSYTSQLPSPNNSGGGGGKSPTSRPRSYGEGFVVKTKVLERDLMTKKTVVNSAGEKFDPPIEYDALLPVYTITTYESEFGQNDYLSGCVNTNSFTINSVIDVPNYCGLARVRQTPAFEGGNPYWINTIEITVDPDGWGTAPLDQGTRKIVPGASGQVYAGDAKFVTITDPFNQPLNHPINLDGNGQPLAPNSAPQFIDGSHNPALDHGDPTIGGFNRYHATQFPPAF